MRARVCDGVNSVWCQHLMMNFKILNEYGVDGCDCVPAANRICTLLILKV